MAEEPFHMGTVKSVRLEGSHLVVRFEESASILAMGCPDWFRELDEATREQWRPIEGGLYWPTIGQALRLPKPMVDPEKLEEAIRELTEDGESE